MAKSDFSNKMTKLDEIVAWFENEEIDAGVALKKFEEGTKIIQELKKELEETENVIKKIKLQ